MKIIRSCGYYYSQHFLNEDGFHNDNFHGTCLANTTFRMPSTKEWSTLTQQNGAIPTFPLGTDLRWLLNEQLVFSFAVHCFSFNGNFSHSCGNGSATFILFKGAESVKIWLSTMHTHNVLFSNSSLIYQLYSRHPAKYCT